MDERAVWEKFGDAIVEIGGATGVAVGVHERLAASDIDRLGALGLTGGFGVITPCNPMDARLSAGENSRRLAEFEATLVAAGIAHVPADGRSRDGRHVEQGFACAIPKHKAVELGIEWGQLAVFWFDGSRFVVVSCVG